MDSGRIVAQRLTDGRTEFGWQLADGGERGCRSSARLLADGRIEFAFTPAGGERILPQSRYFPVGAGVERWLRSTEIELGG